jgi:hypothetical protein
MDNAKNPIYTIIAVKAHDQTIAIINTLDCIANTFA